jgi:hypothetical protein
MTLTLTINEFNALLASDNESLLMKALRKLTAIEKPEDILALAGPVDTLAGWSGWGT